MSEQMNDMSRREIAILESQSNLIQALAIPYANVYTVNAFAEDVHAAKTVGMNEHIAKPLDLNSLARILKKWM